MSFTKTQNKFSKGIDDKADGTAVTIDEDGKLGVGIDDPNRRLHVKTDQQVGAVFESTNETKSRISFTSAATSDTDTAVGIGSENLDLQFYAGGSSSRMTIDETGKITANTGTASSAPIITGTAAQGQEAGVKVYREGTTRSGLSLFTEVSGVQSDAIYCDSDGKVGVGTSAPQKPLSVYGGILAATSTGASTSGITIDSTATSGYAATITHTDLGIEFDPNASDRDFIFKTGNVGIGNGTGGRVNSAGYSTVTLGGDDGAQMIFRQDKVSEGFLYSKEGSIDIGALGDFHISSGSTGGNAGRKLTIKSTGDVTFNGRLLIGSGVTPSIGSAKQVIHNNGNDNCYSSWSGKQNTAGVLMGTDKDGKCAWYTYTGAIGSETTAPTMFLDPSGNLTAQGSVSGTRMIQGGAPVVDAKRLISTLSTLRNATKDETTLEGLRDSIGNAIGGLIEKFEAEIAAMPAPEVGTMDA